MKSRWDYGRGVAGTGRMALNTAPVQAQRADRYALRSDRGMVAGCVLGEVHPGRIRVKGA